MDPEETDYRTIFSQTHEAPIFPDPYGGIPRVENLPFDVNPEQSFTIAPATVLTSPQEFKTLRERLQHNKSYRYYFIAKILLVLGFLTLFTAYVPSLWYFVAARAGIELNSKYIKDTVKNTNLTGTLKPSVYQPPLDTTLPTENRLVISSVKIDTPIHESPEATYEDALKKGVWRVPDFGSPYARERPTILAAHRFGYLKWSVPYRLKNSFFNLPKVKVGDTIDIIWQQRKYTYSVYAEEKGEAITDYNADLILYTCQDLNSSVRIIKYAKLIQI